MNYLDKLVSRNAFFKTLERSTSWYLYPRFGILTKPTLQIRTFAEFCIRTVFFANKSSSLGALKAMAGTKKGTEALVLGNGPSLEKLRTNRVKELQESADLDVFVMNNFALTKVANEIRPQFYVLSDPFHVPENDNPKNIELWRYLHERFEGRLIVPRHWQLQGESSARSIFYEDRSLEGFSDNIDPTRPRGYMSLTALKSITIAHFLGYKRIYVLGLDNSQFKAVRLNAQNSLIEDSFHAVGASTHESKDESEFYPLGLQDYFFQLSYTAKTFKAIFQKIPVMNLNPEALVEGMGKGDPHGLTDLWAI